MKITVLNPLFIRVMFTFLLPLEREGLSPSKLSPGTRFSLRNMILFNLFRRINSAIVGWTVLNRGKRNPPRCTMSLFLTDRGTCRSRTLRSTALCFYSLRVLQTDDRILPFRTFKTHSLIQLTSSLLQFEMIALRNLGLAILSTWRA